MRRLASVPLVRGAESHRGCAIARSRGRTPDSPLPTDMNPPGLEQKLRLRALRFSWIKDVVQAVAFTLAGIWAIYTFWYREKYLPQVSDTAVTMRIVVDALGERDGVVTVRARTILENPGHVPARLLAK